MQFGYNRTEPLVFFMARKSVRASVLLSAIAILLLTSAHLAQACTPGADCARQLYQSYLDGYSQQLAEARKAGNPAKEIEAIFNAAEAHQYFGRFPKTLEIYSQALTLARRSQNRTAEAAILENMAIAHGKLSPFEGIEFLEQQLQSNPSYQATILQVLGAHAIELRNQQKAIAAYTRYLAVADKADPARAIALSNLALSYSELGDLKSAIEIQKQAIDLKRTQRNAELNSYISRLGELYNAQGDSEKAGATFGQLAQSAADRNDAFWAIEGTKGMATSYAALGKISKAQAAIKDAISLTDLLEPSLRSTLKRDLIDRLSLTYAWSGDYATAIKFQQQLGKGFRSGDRAFINSDLDDIYYEHLGAFYLRSGQYKQAEVALRKAIATYTQSRQSDDPNYDNLLTNADETSVANYDLSAEVYRNLQAALVAQNRGGEALEVAEAGRARAFVGLLSTRLGVNPKAQPVFTPPNLEQIKQIAKTENSTLVQYSILYPDITGWTETGKFRLGKGKPKEAGLLIWVVKPTGEVVTRSVDLTKQLPGQTLTDLVRDSRESIGTRGRGLSSRKLEQSDQKTSQTKLQQLHQILIQPIADQLPTNPVDSLRDGKAERVTFLPQDALYLVPFAALQSANGKYLIENHTILMAPSLQVLALSRQSGANAALSPALIVGNPTMPSLRIGLNDAPEPLPELPGAEQEAKTIAQLLNTQALIGSQATKEAIVAQMPQAKLIHLATHGILENLQGLQSAIALAPSGRSDGFLTASQVLQLKLTANLVVLSACDTGRGEITGDGVIGLSRSFISAGVPSVIVSLWAVPDAPTASLMSQFYQTLKQNPDKANALRQAMLKTLKQYPNPKDWAAFTLVGQP